MSKGDPFHLSAWVSARLFRPNRILFGLAGFLMGLVIAIFAIGFRKDVELPQHG
jgi:hypothetical protein